MDDTIMRFQNKTPGCICNFINNEVAAQAVIDSTNNIKDRMWLSFFDKTRIKNRTRLITNASDGIPQ
jgi:hypothetical protein